MRQIQFEPEALAPAAAAAAGGVSPPRSALLGRSW